MKKIISIFSLLLVVAFGSCIEQNYPIWEGAEVEFQDAVVRTPTPGETYPRIAVNNNVGSINLQVNLVAAQRPNDEVITYRVVPEGTTATSADYSVSGNLTIPANESTAMLTVNIADTGAIDGFVDLLLELEGNESLEPSENYKRVQIRINRPAPATDED